MMTMIKSLLFRYAPQLSLLLLGASFGFGIGSIAKEWQIISLKQERDAILTAQLNELSAHQALERDLTRQLLIERQIVQQQREQLKNDIPTAVKTDTDVFTGIGPDSLCLYRQALGYHCQD